MSRCARVSCMRLLAYQVLSFFSVSSTVFARRFLVLLENLQCLLSSREGIPIWECSPLSKQDLSGFWAVFPGRGPKLMSILSRQIFGISRLSRPKLGMSRLWRPKHGISRLLRLWWSVATIAPKQRWRDQTIATHIWYVQTLATKSCHFQTFATEKLRRDFRDLGGYGATLRVRKWRDQT